MDSISFAEATKPACNEGQRRVRTSAAALGLAISMGAAGIVLPKPSNASVVSEDSSKAREVPATPPESLTQAEVLPEAEVAEAANWDESTVVETFESAESVPADIEADSLASALMVPSIDKTVVIPSDDEKTAVEPVAEVEAAAESLASFPRAAAARDDAEFEARDFEARDFEAGDTERNLEFETSDLAEVEIETLLEEASTEPEREQREYVYHSVREGQTLWQISSAYQVDLHDITAANGLYDNADLRVGQSIRIPVREGMNRSPQIDIVADASEFAASRKALDKDSDIRSFSNPSASYGANQPAPDAKAQLDRNVSEGDISEDRVAYVAPLLDNVSPSALDRLSETDDRVAALPQPELALPLQTKPEREEVVELETTVPTLVAMSHEVVRGDTLFAIASRHGVSVDVLIETNNLVNPNALLPGQEIVLPLSPAVESDEPVVALLPDAPSDDRSVSVSVQSFATAPTSRSVTPSRREQEFANTELPEPVAAIEPPAIDSESDDLSVTYAESLRSDVARLRSQQTVALVPDLSTSGNSLASESQEAEVAVAPSLGARSSAMTIERELPTQVASARVNPESSSRQAVREAAAAAALEQTDVTEATAVAPAVAPLVANNELAGENEDREDGLVAVAPIGARNYAPVLPPRAASPDLPELADAGEYLPEAGTPMGNFDGYVWPAQGVLTSGYGWRWGRMHRGIDIGGPTGTPIVAAAPGVVTYARWNSGGYGNLVEVTHPDGSLTLYAHNNRMLVSEGDVVEQGQHIADMGSTGFSTGPHLHFELHAAGQGAIDPVALLR